MQKSLTLLTLLLLSTWLLGQSPYGDQPLAHTYSIVAIDPETGDMGVAVQSHWFATGTLVIWGEAGVGVVATQSFVNPAFGPEGLALMKTGQAPKSVLQQLLAEDEGREVRQVGLLNAKGEVASFTGKKCIEAAGNLTGEGYAVQANLMDNDGVWPAMAKAFEASKGKPLAERLVISLEAAQQAGGDIRGKQSAAILVVAANNTGQSWVDRKVDLRVDDHPNPIQEMKRLLKVHRAYEHMNKGDLAVEHGDIQLAMREYGKAEAMFPDNLEMKFWKAVNLANTGSLAKALPLFKIVFAGDSNWKKLTPRITKNGLLSVDKESLQQILAQ
ncbi:MAG: DUF1028 domain-containing protein [Saprospiraceae bacterium]|nr:DUF1028 domain-containing protein [Saprospiraceae bacterium]